MSADEKAQVLETVEATPGSKRKVLAELGVSKSAYYRWRARARHGSLEDRRHPGPSWNRLSPDEESVALEVALEQTNLSSRQLAAWITDNKGFSISESTVYRLLKSQGLIKSPEMKMAAGKDFHAKATRLTRCGPLTLPTSESVVGASTTWLPSWTTSLGSSSPGGSRQT